MSEELKPCPFCGSTDEEVWQVDEYVKCNDCEAEGPWSFEQGETEAVELWNRRADPLERLEAWRMEDDRRRTYELHAPLAGGDWQLVLYPGNGPVSKHYAMTLSEAVDVALKEENTDGSRS
jgi:Lar family restriction alleviation protein